MSCARKLKYHRNEWHFKCCLFLPSENGNQLQQQQKGKTEIKQDFVFLNVSRVLFWGNLIFLLRILSWCRRLLVAGFQNRETTRWSVCVYIIIVQNHTRFGETEKSQPLPASWTTRYLLCLPSIVTECFVSLLVLFPNSKGNWRMPGSGGKTVTLSAVISGGRQGWGGWGGGGVPAVSICQSHHAWASQTALPALLFFLALLAMPCVPSTAAPFVAGGALQSRVLNALTNFSIHRAFLLQPLWNLAPRLSLSSSRFLFYAHTYVARTCARKMHMYVDIYV